MPLCGHFVCSLGYYRINCFIAVFGKLEALFPRETEQKIDMMEYCKIIDKIYYLPKEYRTHVSPEKERLKPQSAQTPKQPPNTTIDPIYEKKYRKNKEDVKRKRKRKLKKTLSSSWN